MNKTILPLLVCVSIAAPALVRADSGGSIYSRVFIGDLRLAGNVRSLGMGYTGFASSTPSSLNPFAPATWSNLDQVRVEASVLYEGFSSTDGIKNRHLASTAFNGAMIGFPLSRTHGISLVIGVIPYSDVDYTSSSAGSLETGPDTMTYAVQYLGKGGVGRGQAGLTYSPLANLALGASFNYMFGKIENQSTLTPDNVAYAPGNQAVTTRMNGVTFSLGALYEDFSGLSEALKPLSVGVTFTTRGKLSTLEQTLYTWVDQADTSSDREGYVIIPATFGFGLSWKAGERWLLEADYRSQPWTTSEIDGRTPLGIQDMHLMGFGVELLPLRSSTTGSFLSKLTYRFGAYYHQSYVRLNNEPVNAWAVTLGLGIPLTGESRLDLHAEYGIRGTTENGLTKDNIFRFSLALNFSEAWFTRPEED